MRAHALSANGFLLVRPSAQQRLEKSGDRFGGVDSEAEVVEVWHQNREAMRWNGGLTKSGEKALGSSQARTVVHFAGTD
jgi:hypothetical protein